MKVLFDTNILARASQPGTPSYPAALAAADAIRGRGDSPCLVTQVLYEFWVVCTRPRSANGLGFDVTRSAQELARLGLPLFEIFHDTSEVFGGWKRLVVEHDVKGKDAHDARLVAAMSVHGIEAILTFNVGDFTRYPGITVLDPTKVTGAAAEEAGR